MVGQFIAPYGLVVVRPVVGPLQALTPHHLLVLGQVAHHVLARVPLAPLDQGPAPEGLPDGRAEPLAAIEDDQHALGEVEAPLDQRPQERRQHRGVLRVRFDEAHYNQWRRHSTLGQISPAAFERRAAA